MMEMGNCVIGFYILLIGFVNIHSTYTGTTNTERSKREVISYKCVLPDHPENGQWSLIKGEAKPGDEIDNTTVVHIECNEGYRRIPNTGLIFCDKNWKTETTFPKCERICPPIYSTATTKVNCVDKDGNKIECDQAVDGAYLTYECSPYFEPVGNKTSITCQGGFWNYPKPVCQPVCGKMLTSETVEVEHDEREVEDFEYPWVVTIYKKLSDKFEKICGGTLVSGRIVVTAAHCVTNDLGEVLSTEKFEVVAGKYFEGYEDSRDGNAQYRKILKINVPGQYIKENQQAADVAIIVTEKLFDLGPRVQPACIHNVININLQNGELGEIASWGLIGNNGSTDRLKVIKIPYKGKGSCSEKHAEKKNQAFNKICAGFSKHNVSICKGDSGSGVVFKNKDDNRYYLHGLVTVPLNLLNVNCYQERNASFTSISSYYSFVETGIQKRYSEDCKLPNNPDNGKWRLINGADMKPGDIVQSTTMIKYSCDAGYKLSSSNHIYECQNTFNPPTCNRTMAISRKLPRPLKQRLFTSIREQQHSPFTMGNMEGKVQKVKREITNKKRMCQQLHFPTDTLLSCKDLGSQIIDCSEATDGSSLTYTCPLGYETDRKTISSTRYCIGGSYGIPRPDCLPIGTIEGPVEDPIADLKEKYKVICTYDSSWANKSIFPEDLNPKLCTYIVYDSVGIWENGSMRMQDGKVDLDHENKGLYHRITDLKKFNRHLKVLLSVGGKAGNASLFSSLSRDTGKIEAFLESARDILKTYEFDGLNIDWQFPGESDRENYRNLLQNIRDEVDRNGWLLSASVRPYLEDTGYDANAMDSILDWVTIKSYDFYDGKSNYTGNPNALYASSKETEWEKSHLNIDAAAKNWMKAGLSKDKLVLSIAFYGRSYILADKDQHDIHAPVTGTGPGVNEGVLRYYQICRNYTKNFTEKWDQDTQSPYRFNETSWIGFNTKDTVWTRAEYIKTNDFAGVNVYPLDGDDNKGLCGLRHTMLKYVHGGLGNTKKWES